jgi:polar amino acid transport system substrate-binding protein
VFTPSPLTLPAPPLRCLLTAAVLALTVTTAWAHAPALRFAFSELEPWKTRQGGEFGGAYTEIVRELARRLGRPLQIIDCPLKRCLKMLEVGEADIVIGVQQSPERLRYLQYLATPYRRTSTDRVFLLRSGDTRRVARYEDLLGLRIGVKQGSEYFDRFDEDPQLIKDAALTAEASLRKLMLGRVDTVVLPEDQALALLAQLGLRRSVDIAPLRVPDATPRSIAISRASPLLAQQPQLEQAMREMREDGTLAALFNRHYYQRYRVARHSVVID